MPIAIYRHMKLSVAVPLYANSAVSNFSSRILRKVSNDTLANLSQLVKVEFTSIERRKLLLIHHNETWEFNNGKFSIVYHMERNGHQRLVGEYPMPRMHTSVWTQNGDAEVILDQFEGGIAARSVIEHYLFTQTPNPDDYQIVTINFHPDSVQGNTLEHITYPVRNQEEAQTAALTDRSESADAWLKLFETAPIGEPHGRDRVNV